MRKSVTLTDSAGRLPACPSSDRLEARRPSQAGHATSPSKLADKMPSSDPFSVLT